MMEDMHRRAVENMSRACRPWYNMGLGCHRVDDSPLIELVTMLLEKYMEKLSTGKLVQTRDFDNSGPSAHRGLMTVI
jgi:hypothetical protein